MYDADFMNLLKNTYKPKDINATDYKAVYYSGGGSAMFGVPENIEIQNIAVKVYEKNGIVSAGIVNLKTKNGKYLYETKKVNGFPDIFERKTAKYYQEFPFSIENEINKNGGNFQYSKKGRDNYYIIDGRLITGQDPSATISVAEKIIETIKKIQK